MPELGKLLVVVGAVVLLAGLFIWGGFMPRWLGRLPGDIRIERGNSGFYFPIVTCIVISIVLSLIFSLFRR
jgi:membrane protein implicated in regulation of membrane protease activity